MWRKVSQGMFIAFACLPLIAVADTNSDLKIDKVGPIQKVGPIEKVGPLNKVGPSTEAATQESAPSKSTKKNAPQIEIKGTGQDFIDIKPASNNEDGPTNSNEASSEEDTLNEMIFGAHKNGSSSQDGADEEAEDSQSKTEALQRFLGSSPDVTSLQQDTKFEPVDAPERDAPPGMVKLEAFEKPSKNPRKNFPAQAGGNSAGC